MATGGIGSACTKGVVSGLCVGLGEQGIGSGGGGATAVVAAACAPRKSVAKPFLDVKTVTAPAATPALRAVLRVQPCPFVSSAFFFLGFLELAVSSRRASLPIGNSFQDSCLRSRVNGGPSAHTSPSIFRW